MVAMDRSQAKPAASGPRDLIDCNTARRARQRRGSPRWRIVRASCKDRHRSCPETKTGAELGLLELIIGVLTDH
jgi:hypothetical protein